MEFEPHNHYCLEGWQLTRIWKVALQLYKEQHLNGDKQRDLAQDLNAMLDEAIPLKDISTTK